ncbi:MAG: transglutaminase family protein [Burkholderiaceae bacterium]|nr:transglutaminase family protein [Burkholderiaceae bacterium]
MIHQSGLPQATEGYLEPTEFLDFSHPLVREFTAAAVGDASTDRERAVRLFYAVRDRIRYDPYRISFDAIDYRASSVIEAGHGWCVPKAAVLAACARAAGIASAIGLADVVNHLNTEKLRERMGGVDIFYDHGYTAMLLDGHWVKAVPAFNIELCTRFGVQPTEFDGASDALYQEHDASGRLHMQYLRDHGTWSDLPLAQVVEDFRTKYPGMYDHLSVNGVELGRFEDDAPL